MRMRDRTEAGSVLASRLVAMSWHDPIVLGLVRGGVAVGVPIARTLDAPLDVAVARKIGAPAHPEFGVGAVTVDGPPVYDETTLSRFGLSAADLEPAAERERAEARRRLEVYRANRDAPELSGRDVIVVDDGIATGVTARTALRGLRRAEPARLVLAAPVCAREAEAELAGDTDQLVCLQTPRDLVAISRWYESFPQLDDSDVLALLEDADRVGSRR